MRAFLIVILFALSSPLSAQVRIAPPPATPQTFVAQIDPGAPGGDFVWVSLRGRDQHGNIRVANDLLIYDRTSGGAWLVRNFGPAYGITSPTSPIVLSESGCGVALRPGLASLIASDIDGDGRDDIIGYDRASGQVVRYFQRGLADGCQP